MLATRHLLLPGFDLLFPGERVGLHDAVDYRRELRVRLVQLDIAIEAANGESRIEAVGLGFGGDSKLGNLGWRLVSLDDLACSADVED